MITCNYMIIRKLYNNQYLFIVTLSDIRKDHIFLGGGIIMSGLFGLHYQWNRKCKHMCLSQIQPFFKQEGHTPLQIALKRNLITPSSMLIRYGASIDAIDQVQYHLYYEEV